MRVDVDDELADYQAILVQAGAATRSISPASGWSPRQLTIDSSKWHDRYGL